ncbi:MAG: branched-chain amino acid aminotransferase [Saprospiraceae bacterium]
MPQIKITPTVKSQLTNVDMSHPPAFGTVYSDHMFVMDYEDGVWKNPEIKPFDNFTIHPANLTLHYGQSIFEGMKASKNAEGHPLFLRPDMHAKRFNSSAHRMCMPNVPEELFMQAISELVILDKGWIPTVPDSALYVRPFMFATEKYIGVRASKEFKFVIFTCPVGPYYSKSVSLRAEQRYVRATPGGVGEAKTAGNYAASLYPAMKAIEAGYDQVMWMDPYEFNYIQEVGTMNIFFVVGDKIMTPKQNGAILKGITRDSVIQLLKAEGHDVVEMDLSIKKILKAYKKGHVKEVWGTGTAAVISPVHQIAYREKTMDFDPDTYTIGPWLKNKINNLRSGKTKDQFGWIVPAENKILAESV